MFRIHKKDYVVKKIAIVHRGKEVIMKYYRLSHHVVTKDVYRDVQLHTASLHQAMRSTGYAKPYKVLCSAVIPWLHPFRLTKRFHLRK